MAVPCKYWRLLFRSRTNFTSAGLAWASLVPKDANGNNLTTGLTITTNASLINGTTYPISALTDGNAATYCGINYPGSTASTWYYFTFTYAAEVLIDRFLANIYHATSLNSTTIITSDLVDVMVDASVDNVTWVRQASIYQPIPVGAADTLFGALTTSGIYPILGSQEIGGGGGIFGIVSEDGVAQPNYPVVLLERTSFTKVANTTTNQYGGYAFNGLNLNKDFMVIAYDPSGPPYKNALVWDRIKPINTKSNLLPQSAFWARRCRDPNLGSVVSFGGYTSGNPYRYFKCNQVGASESFYYGNSANYSNFDFYPDTMVGGALKFLKSPRYRQSGAVNLGVAVYSGGGTFNGLNTAGNTSNYQSLTFEYIVKAPQSGEGPMIIAWTGTRDSDDVYLWRATYIGVGAGPTIVVSTTTLDVRIPLSTNNLSTVRATAPVVAGNLYHIMVVFDQDVEIKLYLNSTLVATTAIPATGRIFGWNKSASSGPFSYAYDGTWDGSNNSPNLAAIRRFCVCQIIGTGAGSSLGPSGFGGGFAMATMYNRKFTQEEVNTFYDSLINWETHYVPSTYGGYPGQVEADNPTFYWRLNELSNTRGPLSWLGSKDTLGVWEGSPNFNQTGFTTGTGALTTTNGGVIIENPNCGAVVLQSVFTFECFIRPATTSQTSRLMANRIYNSTAPLYISFVNNVLSLTIVDHADTSTTYTCTASFVAGTAYHIAISYDPWDTKLCKFYVNGVVVTSVPATAILNTIGTFIGWIGIGVNPSATIPTVSERFQGQLGEVAIYSYVVPEARIAAHYAARNT